MSESIMALINLVRKRFDLFTKIFVLLFLLCLFADYLYTYYGVNILDFESILPQIVKVLLKKVEFILYWLIPFVCSITRDIIFDTTYSLYLRSYNKAIR